MKVKLDSVSTKYGMITIIGKVEGLPAVAHIQLVADQPIGNDEEGRKKLATQLAIAAGQGGASNQIEISTEEEIEVSMSDVEEGKKELERISRENKPATSESPSTPAPPAPPSFRSARSVKTDE